MDGNIHFMAPMLASSGYSNKKKTKKNTKLSEIDDLKKKQAASQEFYLEFFN